MHLIQPRDLIRESQEGWGWKGRLEIDHLVQPHAKQAHLEHIAQDHIQAGLDISRVGC